MNIEFGKMAFRPLYIQFLRGSPYEDQHININFDYEIPNEQKNEIQKLQTLVNLDKIKCDDEIQTFINATNWVSRILLSDLRPTITLESSFKIAQNILNGVCGANCYAHAVLLNDIFYLLGYKSKYVFCLPMDYHFSDNHVVNLVFSTNQKRLCCNGRKYSLSPLTKYVFRSTLIH